MDLPSRRRKDRTGELFRILHNSISSTTVTPHRARCDCIQEGVATALVEHPGYDDREGPNVVEGSNQGPTRRSLEELEDAVAAAVERSRVGYLRPPICFIPMTERAQTPRVEILACIPQQAEWMAELPLAVFPEGGSARRGGASTQCSVRHNIGREPE